MWLRRDNVNTRQNNGSIGECRIVTVAAGFPSVAKSGHTREEAPCTPHGPRQPWRPPQSLSESPGQGGVLRGPRWPASPNPSLFLT